MFLPKKKELLGLITPYDYNYKEELNPKQIIAVLF